MLKGNDFILLLPSLHLRRHVDCRLENYVNITVKKKVFLAQNNCDFLAVVY